MVERTETRTEVAAPEGTLVIESQVGVVVALEAALISTPM